MNATSKNVIAKSVVANVGMAVVAHFFNKAVYNRLEKVENPGLITRFAKWNFKLGSKPTYVFVAAAANIVATTVLVNSLDGLFTPYEEQVWTLTDQLETGLDVDGMSFVSENFLRANGIIK